VYENPYGFSSKKTKKSHRDDTDRARKKGAGGEKLPVAIFFLFLFAYKTHRRPGEFSSHNFHYTILHLAPAAIAQARAPSGRAFIPRCGPAALALKTHWRREIF